MIYGFVHLEIHRHVYDDAVNPMYVGADESDERRRIWHIQVQVDWQICG
jgi:hypothetical protein